jgi:hypothetical protein
VQCNTARTCAPRVGSHLKVSCSPLPCQQAADRHSMAIACGPNAKHMRSMMSCCAQALQDAAWTVQEYLGHAAIYVSMADTWYDTLYKHSVLGHTASDVGVVAQLDDIMNSIMARASAAAAPAVAAAVARSAFAALRTTLLHGVFRNFVSDDADLITHDLASMQVCDLVAVPLSTIHVLLVNKVIFIIARHLRANCWKVAPAWL